MQKQTEPHVCFATAFVFTVQQTHQNVWWQIKLRFVLWDLLKNWVWNTVFTCFLTEFCKTLFIFAFQKRFWKNLNCFYFFLYFKLILYFVFSDYFDALISKIIFFKIKKYILMYFQVKNTLKSNHNHNHNHTSKHNRTFCTCFLLHINLNHNFYQTHI